MKRISNEQAKALIIVAAFTLLLLATKFTIYPSMSWVVVTAPIWGPLFVIFIVLAMYFRWK